MPNLRDRRGWMLRNRFSPESSTVSRTSKTGRHPALVGMKKVAVGGADVHLRCRKRAATQNFLINKPFVVVLVKLGFESGVRHVVRGRPLPNIADQLMAAGGVLSGGKSADWGGSPDTVLKKICFGQVDRFFSPGKFLTRAGPGIIGRSFLPFAFGRQTLACPFCVGRRFKEADVTHRLVFFAFEGMQAGEVANHPLVVVLFPVKRRTPAVAINHFPAFG